MKPRLESLRWTDEDVEAFNIACRDKANIAAIHCMYWAADRRDADRMLVLGQSWVQLRSYATPAHPQPSDAAVARLTWLLQRGYGSGLGVRRENIFSFA